MFYKSELSLYYKNKAHDINKIPSVQYIESNVVGVITNVFIGETNTQVTHATRTQV